MSKNVTVNGVDYTGVSQVQLPTTAGGTALFKDVDEITTPSGSVTITENGTHDVTNYAQAVVSVASSGESNVYVEFLKAVIGWKGVNIPEDVHFNVPNGVTAIKPYAFSFMVADSSHGTMYIELPDTIEIIYDHAFNYNSKAVIGSLPPNLKVISGYAFAYAYSIFGAGVTEVEIPASVEKLESLAFYQYNGPVNTITFKGTPTTIANNALQCGKITTINVPWAEGTVADAPWGATSATVNYNYTGA